MDGISSLRTINHVVKRGHKWMECPLYKQYITGFKGDKWVECIAYK